MEDRYNDKMDAIEAKKKEKATNIQNIYKQEKKCARYFIYENGKFFDKLIETPTYTWYDLEGWIGNTKYLIELKERTKEQYSIEALSASTMMEVTKLEHMVKIHHNEPTAVCLYINYYFESHGMSWISFNITNRLNSTEDNELSHITNANCPESTMNDNSGYYAQKPSVYLKCQKKYDDKLVIWRQLITDYN